MICHRRFATFAPLAAFLGWEVKSVIGFCGAPLVDSDNLTATPGAVEILCFYSSTLAKSSS